jgi:hypothetical protein
MDDRFMAAALPSSDVRLLVSLLAPSASESKQSDDVKSGTPSQPPATCPAALPTPSMTEFERLIVPDSAAAPFKQLTATPSASNPTCAKSTAFYLLAISRGLASVISAFSILLALLNIAKFSGYSSEEYSSTSNYLILGTISFITLITFLGMFTSSLFAQAFRANQAFNAIGRGKNFFENVPVLIILSTLLYGIQLGLNTVVSFSHVPQSLGTAFGVVAPLALINFMLALGSLSAFGYLILTILYNIGNTKSHIRAQEEGFAPHLSLAQILVFITGNLFPQIAINTLITYFFLNSYVLTSNNNETTYLKLTVALSLSLLTLPELYSSQISSFLKNTKNDIWDIIRLAFFRRSIFLPNSASYGFRLLFGIIAFICNFSVLMIAPSNSNALPSFVTSALPAATDATTLRIIYFSFFAFSALFDSVNAGSYMAFNTVPALNAILFYLLTGRLPDVKQMTFLTALQKLQSIYEKLTDAEKSALDNAWKNIYAEPEKLAKITSFVIEVEKLLKAYKEDLKTSIKDVKDLLTEHFTDTVDTEDVNSADINKTSSRQGWSFWCCSRPKRPATPTDADDLTAPLTLPAAPSQASKDTTSLKKFLQRLNSPTELPTTELDEFQATIEDMLIGYPTGEFRAVHENLLELKAKFANFKKSFASVLLEKYMEYDNNLEAPSTNDPTDEVLRGTPSPTPIAAAAAQEGGGAADLASARRGSFDSTGRRSRATSRGLARELVPT